MAIFTDVYGRQDLGKIPYVELKDKYFGDITSAIEQSPNPTEVCDQSLAQTRDIIEKYAEEKTSNEVNLPGETEITKARWELVAIQESPKIRPGVMSPESEEYRVYATSVWYERYLMVIVDDLIVPRSTGNWVGSVTERIDSLKFYLEKGIKNPAGETAKNLNDIFGSVEAAVAIYNKMVDTVTSHSHLGRFPKATKIIT